MAPVASLAPYLSSISKLSSSTAVRQDATRRRAGMAVGGHVVFSHVLEMRSRDIKESWMTSRQSIDPRWHVSLEQKQQEMQTVESFQHFDLKVDLMPTC